MSAGTKGERVFCLFLMVVGVVGYSYAISAFSSLFATLDAHAAKLRSKLQSLAQIQAEIGLDPAVFARLKRSLLYDHNNSSVSQNHALLE